MGAVRWLGIVAVMAAASWSPPSARLSPALAAPAAINCTGLALHVTPGIHPPLPGNRSRPPADAPRTPFTVGVPLYPGMTPLQRPHGSPYSEVIGSPYLQTASAQFRAPTGSATVQAWYERVARGCGWRENGSWSGNSGAYPFGDSFTRGKNEDNGINFDVGFTDEENGTALVGITVQTVRYPAPPPAARIHGPFVQLRIALTRFDPGASRPHTLHAVVADRSAIAGLVHAIDGIRQAYTVPTVCYGGLHTIGPAWLTFLRPDGLRVHAYESGPGACGGLAVNGFRWLLDPDTVWSRILPLTRGNG